MLLSLAKKIFIGNMLMMLVTVCCQAADQAERPNIVVILSDDAGYHDFSMHGSSTPTPRIDSIAANGVRFTNGYVSGSVCSPTRAGLLTGRYQECFGHEYNIPPRYSDVNGLPLTETLLPRVLKDAGYQTIGLGKWHLGYAPKFHPLERGFTDFYGFLQGARSYFPLPKPTRLNRLLRDREQVLPEEFGYMTDHLAEEAAAYIERYKDQPFFMYLAFNATHGPLHATKADLALTGGEKVPAMTIALDRAVGTVLDTLDKNQLTDNTIVVFLNDNGGTKAHDNRPLRGNKGSCWDGGVRVPFVMQWPRIIPKGQVSNDPVISLDLFPTALAAAGISQSHGKPLHGVDLVPYLTGKETGRPHQTLYWKNGRKWAVRDGDLKVVDGEGSGDVMLFNIAQDMREQNDLAAAQPDDVARLTKLFETWKATHKPTLWGPKESGQ